MTDSTADTVLDLLRAELGDAVITDQAALDVVRSDKSGWIAEGRPLAVVNARSVADVQTVMRVASAHRVPVVPRGAGTGLAGGAAGTNGSIVLSTALMNRILEVSVEDELAVVEPGVLNQALSDAVAHHGLTFSPDPASKAISTIGGNIATNAGGLLCAKYGVTREAVRGLTVVLADGRLLTMGQRSVKGVTGYDLAALFTGSEGTLGIIVEATVALRTLPMGETVTLGAFFASVTAAASACSAVTAARVRPAVMELIDSDSLAAVDSFNGTQLRARGAAFVLIQTDGADAGAEADRAFKIVTASGGDAELSRDAATGERLLAIRRSTHPALEAIGEVLIEDVCVPRSKLATMFTTIESIGERYGISIPTVAHAGDGNLHPLFVVPRGSDGIPDYIWEAASELFRAALALGGTLTGEHGVGVLKQRWLEEEIGPDSLTFQKQIKAVFDPLGILNPGKVFG